MAVQDIPTLQAANTAQIYDNVTEDITGTILHDLLRDILDSSINRETDPYVGGVIYVDSALGNDITGRRNDRFRRFASIFAAEGVALPGDTIIVLPGSYVEVTPRGVDGVQYHFMDGTVVVGAGSAIWGGAGISYSITGNAIFKANNFIFYCNSCYVQAEYKSAEQYLFGGGIAYCLSGIYKFKQHTAVSAFNGFVLDVSGGGVGGDRMDIEMTGYLQAEHALYSIINAGGYGFAGLPIIRARVPRNMVGYTSFDNAGWGTYNIGGVIDVVGNWERVDGALDSHGAWHYAHASADGNSRTRIAGKHSGQMRYGALKQSIAEFYFEFEPGTWLNSNDVDAASVPVRWETGGGGVWLNSCTLHNEGNAAITGYGIHVVAGTPMIEAMNARIRQVAGIAADGIKVPGALNYKVYSLFQTGKLDANLTDLIGGTLVTSNANV
jgi:hypothetical protein